MIASNSGASNYSVCLRALKISATIPGRCAGRPWPNAPEMSPRGGIVMRKGFSTAAIGLSVFAMVTTTAVAITPALASTGVCTAVNGPAALNDLPATADCGVAAPAPRVLQGAALSPNFGGAETHHVDQQHPPHVLAHERRHPRRSRRSTAPPTSWRSAATSARSPSRTASRCRRSTSPSSMRRPATSSTYGHNARLAARRTA